MGEPVTKHSWNRELEFGLPDSRLTVDRAKGQQRSMTPLGRMWMDRVFCMNCGCDGGLATPELQFLSYLCDGCAHKWGTPPGMAEVPDAVVQETRQEAEERARLAERLNMEIENG